MHKKVVQRVIGFSVLLLMVACSSSQEATPTNVRAEMGQSTSSPISSSLPDLENQPTPTESQVSPVLPTATVVSQSNPLNLARELPIFGDSIAYSPDGQMIAVSNYESNDVRIIDPNDGTELFTLAIPEPDQFRGPIPLFTELTFSHDNRYLAGGGYWETIYVWDLKQQTLIRDSELGEVITALEFSPNDHWFAWSTVGEASNASLSHMFENEGCSLSLLGGTISDYVFLETEPILVTSFSIVQDNDGAILFLSLPSVDSPNCQQTQYLYGESEYGARSVDISEDDRYLVSVVGNDLHVWDVLNAVELDWTAAYQDILFIDVEVSLLDTIAAVDGFNGFLYLFALESGELLAKMDFYINDDISYDIEFSPDGTELATIIKHRVQSFTQPLRIWELP